MIKDSNKRLQKLIATVLATIMVVGAFAVCNVPVITTANAAIVSEEKMPLDTDTSETSDTDTQKYDFKVGDIVELRDDARDYYGESISWLNSLWDYEVIAVSGDKVTISTTYFGLYDVIKDVHAKDLILVSRPVEPDSEEDTDTMEDEPIRISVGSKVGIDLGAMDYYGENISTVWSALVYTVTDINGDKVNIKVVLTPSVLEDYAGITKEEIAEAFNADPESIAFQFIYNAIMSFGYDLEFVMNIKDIHLLSGGISVDELPLGTYRTKDDLDIYEVDYDSDSDILYTTNKIDEIPEDYQLVITEVSKGGYACVYYGRNADDGIFGHVDAVELEFISSEALANSEKFAIGDVVTISEDCSRYYNGKTFVEVGVAKDRITTPSIYKAPFVIKEFFGDAVLLRAYSTSLSKNEYYNDIVVGIDDINYANGTYKNTAQTSTYTYNSRTGEFTASSVVIPANTSLYYTGELGFDADDAVLAVVYKGKTSYVAARALEFVKTDKTSLCEYEEKDEVYLDPEVTEDYWGIEFEDYSVSWRSYFGKAFTDELLHNAIYEVIDTYNDYVVIRETEKSARLNDRKDDPSEKYDLYVHMDDISDEKYPDIVIGGGDVMFGDANEDGRITMADVTLIQKKIARLEVFDDEQELAADVNGDNKVSMTDVILVQQYIAKLIKEFPVEK